MEIMTLPQIREMSKSVANGGLFNMKNSDQVYTMMLVAQSENLHPIKAVQMYSIINGMPSLKATEIQSRFQDSGGKLKWIETTNKKAVVELSHPSYDGKYTSEFTIEDATAMGLSVKDNWKKMPKQMLMARAISSGVRAVYPRCLNNMYSEIEAQDMPINEDIDNIEVEDIETVTIEDKPNYKELLKIRLRKLDFTNAMIKEFVEINNLANDEVLLEDLATNNDNFMKKIEEFENGNK